MPAECGSRLPHLARVATLPRRSGPASSANSWVYAEIIRHLGRHERRPDRNSVASEKHARKLRTRRMPSARIFAFTAGQRTVSGPATRLHFRSGDYVAAGDSPAQSDRPMLSAVTWRFNAWANIQLSARRKIASRMVKAARAHEIRPVHGKLRVVLEGGSIDVNGCGTLTHHRECPAQQDTATQSRHVPQRLRKTVLDHRGEKCDLSFWRHRR